MKMVYFAGSIRGDREYAELYHRMIDFIKKKAIVLTEHVGDSGICLGGTPLASCCLDRLSPRTGFSAH